MKAEVLFDDTFAISPLNEACAYEALWHEDNASLKTIHEKLEQAHATRLSQIINADLLSILPNLANIRS